MPSRRGSSQPRDQTACFSYVSCIGRWVFSTEPPGKPKHFLRSVKFKLFIAIVETCVCVCVSHSVVSDSLRPHGLWPAKFLCPWNSPGKNTGVDSYSLLQGIFQTQGLNPGLLHCRKMFYHLSYQGSHM